jgi:outer membrane protein insertion porin family
LKNFVRWGIFTAVVLWGSCISQAAELSSISKIEVSGNRRIERDAILEKMKLKNGSVPTAAAVREDILSIFEMGYFEDLQVDFEAGVLKVKVKERPVVTKIEYSGSEEFESKDLEEASNLKPFHVLNLANIRKAQETISKKYEEKGYYLARAEYDLVRVDGKPSEVTLKFRIRENEKVKIRRIFFNGNKVMPTGELKQNIASAEGHAFSWATSGGTYREAVFERDLSLLAFYYGNKGYIEAKFTKPRVTLSQDRRYVDINIDVEEGKQFFLGNVSFHGDDLFTEDDLRKSFDMKEKDVFSTGKLQEEVLKLTDKYGDKGYAFANVIPRTQIREGTQIVDLNFEIERGEKAYWGKISVTGNSKTHDKVIRRELRFHEGELYNATRRKKSVDRVRSLGFFGNDVNFLTSSPKEATNILDLEIRVVEKPTGTLNVSAGYGSASGFLFSASVTQNNLFGKGQQLNFTLSLNQNDSKQFRLGFTDPKVFDSEWLAGSELYWTKDPIGSFSSRTYTQENYGGTFRMGREVVDNLTLYSTYKLEYYNLLKPISPENFYGVPKIKSPTSVLLP